MNKTDNSDEFLLSLVFVAVLILLVFPAWLLNNQWLSINRWLFWTLVLLPLISIYVALLLSGNAFRVFGKLPYIKYRPRLPLLFYYDEKPERYRYKECRHIKEIIETGDVLLRRHDHYIDGLILLQNAYYSHAGIARKDDVTGAVTVYHAIGAKGVTEDVLENFSRCDDLAILRFNGNKNLGRFLKKHANASFFREDNKGKKLMSKMKNTELSIPQQQGNSKINIDLKDVRELVASPGPDIMINGQPASKVELKIYDTLVENINKGNYVTPDKDQYLPVIMKLAEGSKGIPYDYDFNFQNFKTMSCVEFVWFCYKSLFPVHQVKRRVYTYFGFIKTFVLVPDLFLASPAFDLVYSGIDSVNMNKRKLIQHTKTKRVQFWSFIATIVFLQLALLVLISVLGNHLSEKYPDIAYLMIKPHR